MSLTSPSVTMNPSARFKRLLKLGTAFGLALSLSVTGGVTAAQAGDVEAVLAQMPAKAAPAAIDLAAKKKKAKAKKRAPRKATKKAAAKKPAAPKADAIIPVDPAWPVVPDAGIADAATEARITEIMSQMTLEEKVGQTVQADINFITPEELKTYPLGSILAGGNSSPGQNERATPDAWLQLADDYWRASLEYPSKVKIPVLFGIDAVHGHSNLVGAVIFPHNVGLGAAHNPELIRKIGEATAKEMAVAGVDWTFAPTVAVARDKRWGRAYESYSENPADVAAYSGYMVEGLQGAEGARTGIKPGNIMSTAKHYLGDGGTTGGKDQGDAEMSESDLARIHNAGYPPAIEAGTLSVMISFSSWNGQKLAGSKKLITGALKQRMGFDGFAITDWNAHRQIPGCEQDDCPQAINAGVDMYMAPDTWKAVYTHLLADVKSGEVPMARLDDAVRRILRAKIKGGLFELGAPKDRAMSGQWQVLGSPEHRAIARQAVRESLVLIKNNNRILPLRGSDHILVTGSGAHDVGKQSGGWTITWQGTGNSREDFPNAQSIWEGIAETTERYGGTASLSVDGVYKEKPDVAVVVIGEDPYAEFQGDRPNLDYQPGDATDLALIKKLKDAGIPVVTVFLSGRPMWTNPEINASDAFVAAWLPGTEGGGVADVIVADADKRPRNDFKGKLTFSWPKAANQQPLNVGTMDYDPQFAYGYGLTYLNDGYVPVLSEESGLAEEAVVNVDTYFASGRIKAPWSLNLIDVSGSTSGDQGVFSSPGGAVSQSAVDAGKQEAGRSLTFSGSGRGQAAISGAPVDLSRQTTGKMTLGVTYRLDAPVQGPVLLGMGVDASSTHPVNIASALTAPVGEWATVKVTLDCFVAAGVDVSKVGVPFSLTSDAPLKISYSSIKIASDEGDATCPK
ncbi:glycoside hydrolase family 3 protein [Asticcacaulis biprosthecium]|nr:exo 1,3/1,4-beta-D-glucan glucohydrolase [Asticcacaulis biprosthecium]